MTVDRDVLLSAIEAAERGVHKLRDVGRLDSSLHATLLWEAEDHLQAAAKTAAALLETLESSRAPESEGGCVSDRRQLDLVELLAGGAAP